VVDHGLVHVVAVHALAAEAREQRGVDVEDAVVVAVGDLQQRQPAGEADQVDLRLIAEGEDALAEGVEAGELATVDDLGGHAGGHGAIGAAEAGARRDDQRDLDRQGAGGAEVDEVLQRAAATGEEDGDAEGFGHVVVGGKYEDGGWRMEDGAGSSVAVARRDLDPSSIFHPPSSSSSYPPRAIVFPAIFSCNRMIPSSNASGRGGQNGM